MGGREEGGVVMPLIRYKTVRMKPERLRIVTQANAILDEYEAMGYDLTLRQLYYQFVARGLIPNKQSEYSRLGDIVSDARMAGMIDWHRIIDRGRYLRDLSHWATPADIIKSSAYQYRVDKWDDQPYRVEVWIEKDALVGVIAGVCQAEDVPFFSCRGYTSSSEMWAASQRIIGHLASGQKVRILHLGDHDPSGIDMTRDITDRLGLFVVSHAVWGEIEGHVGEEIENAPWDWLDEHFKVDRLALNMDQVREHNPPPNPAKITDSRAAGYIAQHGRESWELDALPPDVMGALIQDAILDLRDADRWQAAEKREQEQRDALKLAADYWEDVTTFLNTDETINEKETETE